LKKGNETLTGQWNSLNENLQIFGRDLGALVLPALKNFVEVVNLFVQGFREVADKGKLIGELFEAGMDVAILTIADKWNKMLVGIAKATTTSVSRMMKGMSSGTMSGVVSGVMSATGQRRGGPRAGALEAAKNRLSGLVAGVQAQAPVPVAPPPLLDPKVDLVQQAGSKLTEGVKGLFENLMPVASNAMLAAQSKMTDLGIKGNWLGSVAQNMFGVGPGSDGSKKKPERSEAANKGSQEALRIAMRGSKSTFEAKALKLQEQANELAAKTLVAMKDATVQLVAEF
jgi:hypothetical protein